MKKLILLEICFLFLATGFQGDRLSPGWVIQQIPVNKEIVDIYFIDNLNGWAVTDYGQSYDTGYILKTTNGGNNWNINFAAHFSFMAIQFVNYNTGYACGGYGDGRVYKTTNNGNNWTIILDAGQLFTDLWFVNKDTGWVADDGDPFGIGLIKTTNGGINWFQQLNYSFRPEKLFFLNKDTGWMVNSSSVLYRTINSGNNWFLNYDFGTSQIQGIFFTSNDTGWVSRWGSNDQLLKTINSGYNWQVQMDPDSNNSVHCGIFMINSKLGYISTAYSKILKTTDGINWGKQNAPQGGYGSIFFTDSLHGWSSRVRQVNSVWTYDIVATTDGGGPVTKTAENNIEIIPSFKLEQNYPNPFNPTTKIKFEIPNILSFQRKLESSNVKLKIFDVSGKEIFTLVNEELQTGTYTATFDGRFLPSGIYIAGLYVNNNFFNSIKMLMIK
jgi:photosystem II stability/assembly factor-like uncharacterized protein